MHDHNGSKTKRHLLKICMTYTGLKIKDTIHAKLQKVHKHTAKLLIIQRSKT